MIIRICEHIIMQEYEIIAWDQNTKVVPYKTGNIFDVCMTVYH